MNEQKLDKDYRPQSISTEFKDLFIFAWEATQSQRMDDVISSKKYVEQFYKWLKPKDARNNEKFKALIETVTGNDYSWLERRSSEGSPQKGNKASLCFGASAQFHGTHIEKHFARFLYFWNTFREENPVEPGVLAKPDFSGYKTETEKLLKKYRLIPTKRHPIEQYPFAAQLQRHFPSQDFEHQEKFDNIKSFIDTHPSGYVMIEDGIGTDKSRLAAYTAKTLYDTGQYQCIWHFNEMGSGHNRSADFLRTLFSQLNDMYPSLEGDRFALEYERVLNSESGFAAFYKTVFDQLACDEKFLNGKLVILIDTLDEVSQSDPSRQEAVNTLFLPQSLISNAFIIVTSKNFKHETYIGNKLKIRLSEIETCHENEQTTTESRHGIDRVKGAKKWLDPYNFDALPLEGRDDERKSLDKFIKDGGQFKIWAIVGPSGAGKTRLASQWAYESAALKDWNRRFLHKEDRAQPEKWSDWIPDKPTLLIIDYMYGFEAVIQKLMHHRLEPDVPKIRLLLIDHVFSEPLHSDKRWGFSGDGSSLNRNEKYFYETKPLDLRQTQDQEAIIKSIIAHRAKINKKSNKVNAAHDFLQNTQGAYHPLFAALVGDAIESGKDFTQWNRRELIDYYLSGDKRLPWKHEGDIGRWASYFIAVATARRKIAYDDLKKAAKNCPSRPKYFGDVKAICQKTITNDDEITLNPFEPDILGESFFLKFLHFLNDIPDYQEEFQQILMAGDENTQTEDSKEFIAFIERLTRNLLNDDQNLKETQEFWNSLINFMNPLDFRDAKPIMWAVTVGLLDIIDVTQSQFPEKIFALLTKIEPTVLYNVNHDKFLNDSVLYSMYHFELICKHTKIVFGISTEMHTLFDRHMKIYPEYGTPLMIASYYQFHEMINELATYDKYIEATIPGGWNALMFASVKGYTETVRCLLNTKKIDINAVDDENRTALMWASENGHIETVRLLLENGANINIASEFGHTALLGASENSHVEIVRLLLLAKQVNIDGANYGGRTALMLASEKGYIEIVRLLLNKKANIRVVDDIGCNVLMGGGVSPEVVSFFFDKGVNIHAKNKKGETALTWAVGTGNILTALLLLDLGADIDIVDEDGRTPLMLASRLSYIQIAKMLLERGANIDATDDEGRTALIWASYNDHISMTRLLISKGADIQITDKKGRTALFWANANDHIEIVELLHKAQN